MDASSDLSHKEQVSIVVQYVDSQCNCIEYVDSTDAEAQFQILLKSLSKVGLTTDTLVGEFYDGASNMQSVNAEIQADCC